MGKLTVGALYIFKDQRDAMSGCWVSGKDGFIAVNEHNEELPFLVVTQASLENLNVFLGHLKRTEVSFDQFGMIQKVVVAGAERSHLEDHWSEIKIGEIEMEGGALYELPNPIFVEPTNGTVGRYSLAEAASYRTGRRLALQNHVVREGKEEAFFFGRVFTTRKGSRGILHVCAEVRVELTD